MTCGRGSVARGAGFATGALEGAARTGPRHWPWSTSERPATWESREVRSSSIEESDVVEIPVICSWCKKSLGVVGEESNAQLTSDGICEDCDTAIRERAGLKKRGG